ncbi:hypothetical protein MVEN_02033200 [Mycena venus]|uniref:Cupredoxin n=1 Tax=Mycena venus TaxID=2733690 RepID=A0A8H6XBN3_9AGAR|nr:hypothetical protein MVEN_02033200 [Mycena venus]
MRFSLAVQVSTALVLSVSAADILVLIGAGGQLAFSPPNVTANVGDTIAFQFQGKNHSVTQSTFVNPCQIQTTPMRGLDSGFQFVNNISSTLPQWSFTVDNTTAPLWFFCAQTHPTNHCQKGMVFSVNANPDGPESFAVFQQAAMGNAAEVESAAAAAASAARSAAGSTAGDIATDSVNAITDFGGPTASVLTGSESSSTSPPLVVAKKKNLAGPIAGGVVVGVILLAVLGFLFHSARRRRHNNAEVAMQYDWTPVFSRLPTGQASLSSSPEPRFPLGMPADPEKARLEAAEQMDVIQQEIQELREQASASGLESASGSSTGGSDRTNAQLLDAVRMLTDEMHALKQQVRVLQAEEPPQYTPNPSHSL